MKKLEMSFFAAIRAVPRYSSPGISMNDETESSGVPWPSYAPLEILYRNIYLELGCPGLRTFNQEVLDRCRGQAEQSLPAWAETNSSFKLSRRPSLTDPTRQRKMNSIEDASSTLEPLFNFLSHSLTVFEAGFYKLPGSTGKFTHSTPCGTVTVTRLPSHY